MERRERISDDQEALRLALAGWQSGLWTAMPAIIDSFDASAVTVTAHCAISFTQRMQDGKVASITMPQLVDVPVVAMRGGSTTMTFPIKPGDECLIIFANRCIDGWWKNGGVQKQSEIRMHDLSDGFALIGPFSQAKKISDWNTDATEIRSNDGMSVVRLNPTTQQIDVQNQTGNINVVSRTGNVNVASTAGNVNVATAEGDIALAAIGISLAALTCQFLSNNGDTLLNLNPTTGTIDLTTKLGNINIDAVTGNVFITAGGNITIDATPGGIGNTITLKAKKIDLLATTEISLVAPNVTINGVSV